MVEITNKLVDDLAHLSRLTFNEEEKEAIKSDLKEMISFVEKLNEVDTSNVEPLLHITPHQNILRDDVIEGSITREEALKNVPNTDGEYILVPKVIKK
ncbi:Asp-tRNA(Asn)/Glu-tRNA(Gln) amidotransferase GatCAB subunit C [Arachidicoccus soli]|uniref:Aspartyl/glutamyl-tRNA(Asn/Gln) amidotransferase subunit C n=2 Tax=Arachidicoccus soli TaxID=2341117 RepID=A0A386HUP7_9BACT|nr:Asp-tRNA(Asn)/Glu-tRNA(Gln) amidotransferase GatCAB subunit C [Arachidicoccus soli]